MARRFDCKICGGTYDAPIRRGRPPVKCDECKATEEKEAAKIVRRKRTPKTLDGIKFTAVARGRGGVKHSVAPKEEEPTVELTEAQQVALENSRQATLREQRVKAGNERIDRLDMMLKAHGIHLSQIGRHSQ